MTYFQRVIANMLFVAAVVLAGVACESDDDEGEGSRRASNKRAGDGEASGDPKTVKWGVFVGDGEDEDAVLEGLEVCVYPGLKECEALDAQGHAFVDVPADTDTAVLLDGSSLDYIKVLTTFHAPNGDTDDNEFYLVSDARAQELAGGAGYRFDPKLGSVIGQALDKDWAPVEGVAVSLDPAEGVGPVYYNAEGPNKDLTSTSADDGRGIIGRVPPGDYALTYSGKRCVVGANGWEGEHENISLLPVLAGVRTLVVAQCE